MQFLKTFGLLLMLVMSNVGIASANNISLPHFEEELVEFEFSEDQQNLSESILITPAKVNPNRVFVSNALVPEQLCPREISRTNMYRVYSRSIVPSLDIADIIFPFHFFL